MVPDEYVSLRKQAIHKDENGREYIFDKRGNAGQKRYLDVALKEGRPVDSVWDIRPLTSSSSERLGYPTQKPRALLERIIKTSSNEGDLVLDAYCGCGTTVMVAEKLGRPWIGIDITYQSIGLICQVLEDTYGTSVLQNINLGGIPRDVDSARALANKKDDRVRKEFEKWAVLTYSNNRAVINPKKGADRGIDGMAYFLPRFNLDTPERYVFQVKSGAVHRNDIAAFNHDRERERAQLGAFITLEEPTSSMRMEAREAGFYYHETLERRLDRVQIVTVKEIIEQERRIEVPLNYRTLRAGAFDSSSAQQMGLF